MKRILLVVTIFLLAIPTSWSQKEGHASYSPLFSPQLLTELPEEVKESSGLFFYNGLLWTHNDSGGKPILYALDTASFEVVQRITVKNAKNKDWEDVCTDGEHVYVGDFGNNKGSRDNLRIYKFPLAEIPERGDDTVTAEIINFSFADQTNFEKRKMNDFDCESIFATDQYIYLFSKGWETGTTRLYRLSKQPGTQVAEVVNGFDSQGLITGADYDRKNGILVLVGYVNKIWLPFMYLIYDFDDAGVKLSNRRFEMHQLMGTQTEGVCFYDEGKCFLSAETSPTVTTRVFTIDFNKYIKKDNK